MNLLGMFARQPVAGQTKTRLAASIGDEATVALYSGFVEDLLQRCPGIADSFVAAVIHATRDSELWFRARLPAESGLVFQPEGDIGEKIDWFFQYAHQLKADRTILIGSDSPDLPSEVIRQAFERLQNCDLVVVPATDGGFVLAGLRTPVSGLFSDVCWSSGRTLLDVLARSQTIGLRADVLRPWYDIDTVQNLGAFIALQEHRGSEAAACPCTNAAIKQFEDEILAGLSKS